MNLYDLIHYPESNWLDFKSEWPQGKNNTGEFIFDVLCMANSAADKDRYLVYGYDQANNAIVDNKKRIWTDDGMSEIIERAGFINTPDIEIKTIQIDGKELDVVIIRKNNNRPYWLTKDCELPIKTIKGKEVKRAIRANVIYTRPGAKNTAHNESATENQIADMWREKFGLTLSPMERLKLYIQETDKWKQVNNPLEEKNIFQYYYEQFPEFTIDFGVGNLGGKDKQGNIIRENHLCGHTTGNSEKCGYVIKYLTTILVSGYYLRLDNARYHLIEPDERYAWYKKDNTEVHIETESLSHTDTGYTPENIEEINELEKDERLYNRARIPYHIIGSLKHGLQKILDNKIYKQSYLFRPKDNEDIACYVCLVPSANSLRNDVLQMLKLDTDPNPPK